MNLSLSPVEIRNIIEMLIILVLSIAVHEFGHAYVAHLLGDRLPQSQGRVTLNPLAHADPIGTLAFPLVGLLLTGGNSIGFGWGKPVQVNPLSFSRRFRMRVAHMFVAAAGPAMNLLFGCLIAVIHVTLIQTEVIALNSDISHALYRAVGLNFVLLFFNLIPAHPLDGGAVVEGLLPDHLVPGWQKFSVYGPFILFAVIFSPQLASLFVTPAMWLRELWCGLIGLPV